MRDLNSTIIRRFSLTCAALTVGAFIVIVFFDKPLASGILFGNLFCTTNVWVIASLTSYSIIPEKRNPRKAWLSFALKLPVMYGILWLVLSHQWISSVGFAIGFQMALMILLAISAISYIAHEKYQMTKGDDAA